jgi:hypothetical protein
MFVLTALGFRGLHAGSADPTRGKYNNNYHYYYCLIVNYHKKKFNTVDIIICILNIIIFRAGQGPSMQTPGTGPAMP